MPMTGYKPEPIVSLLRQMEVEIAHGTPANNAKLPKRRARQIFV